MIAAAAADPALSAAAAKREVTVTFNADTADGMPWRFYPAQRSVVVHPGESTLVFYTAENRSAEPVTGVSVYNVAPSRAGLYFTKVQCFCFEEQQLGPGEKIDLPILFYLDPAFATDRKCDPVNNITLSYTFFRVGAERTEAVLEAAAARDLLAEAEAAEAAEAAGAVTAKA